MVYAIITFDVDNEDYYINLYSFIDNVYETMLYEPIPEYNDMKIIESTPFDYDIDVDGLVSNVIENAYFVEFDSNGGVGTMPKQLMLPGIIAPLHKNSFTRSGYVFEGWEFTNENGTITFIDKQNVSDLAASKETVILKACWSRTTDPSSVYTLTTKNGTISSSPKITYNAEIEYRNRTETSVDIRIKWKSTIGAKYYTVYGQNFKFSVGSANSSTVKVAAFNTWKNISSSSRSKTAESGWVTVQLNTPADTTLDLAIYYWQTNSNNLDMYKYDGTPCLKTTWKVTIPAYN